MVVMVVVACGWRIVGGGERLVGGGGSGVVVVSCLEVFCK